MGNKEVGSGLKVGGVFDVILSVFSIIVVFIVFIKIDID